MPDVDLFLRSSGEQRTSNFLLWQSAYAEMVFLDTLFPDFDRRHLWEACEIYASRDRRYGGALDRTDTTRDVVSREAATTAGLLITARESLEQFVEVHVDDDGALSFRHGAVPCAVQGVELVEGLAVLSLTCVVAWDLTRRRHPAPGRRTRGPGAVRHPRRRRDRPRVGRDPALRVPRGGPRAGPARHAAHARRVHGGAGAGRPGGGELTR